MTDKFKDGESMLPAATEKKPIKFKQPAGKTQVIINPPEKVDPQRGFQERFKTALQKHTIMMEKRTELVLQAKAARTHFPEESVKQVYIRGFKSLPLNSELTREQYAMNRVNSFIAGGAALVEDCDLLPIYERVGMKGTGGAMRPHIKREKSVYNGKTLYHVVDAMGNKKHSTTDEFAAKKHLAQKYHAYMKEATTPLRHTAGAGMKDEYSSIRRKVPDGQRHVTDKPYRMAKEEVELDEVSTDGYYKAAIKSRMNAAVKVASSMGKDKQAVTKLNARNAGMKRAENRTHAELKKANSGPQKPSHSKPSSMSSPQAYYASKKPGEYTGDSYEPQGQMLEAQSAAVRWQKALANAKKKREEEEARNAENAKRALAPRDNK